jgi:hypothetical protein
VQVHYDEGIANRIGPEPCVVGREAGGEASAGVHIGQPLVRQAKLARSSRCNKSRNARNGYLIKLIGATNSAIAR